MRRFGPPLVLREPPRACLGEKRRDDEMLRQKSLKEKIVFLIHTVASFYYNFTHTYLLYLFVYNRLRLLRMFLFVIKLDLVVIKLCLLNST